MLSLLEKLWALIRQTVMSWLDDHVSRMAAALAFYTIFSLAPSLLIGLTVAETIAGTSTAQGELITQLSRLVGKAEADYVFNLLQSSRGRYIGSGLTLFGVGAAFVAAMMVFSELQGSMNSIWRVQPDKGSGILRYLYTRAISFVLVVAIGILLLVSIMASSMLSGIESLLSEFNIAGHGYLAKLNSVVSFAVIPILLAMAYKLIPLRRVEWRDVWPGVIIVSGLFLAGRSVLGHYMSLSGMRTIYGAAGSLVILLLWIYYLSQIFFLGAEMTKVYAQLYGSRRGRSLTG
jgi:membrane protein